MAKTKLSAAAYVERGYGQVEPNHLSAQRNGRIYAQLPADPNITVLENGQFVKYDYENGIVTFNSTADGAWYLVFNEVKVYRDGETDADFAMIKDNYAAAVYSPVDGASATSAQARDYSAVVTPADPYEVDSTANPFSITKYTQPFYMPTGTVMTPRVFATEIGDIFTTNTVNEATLTLGQKLTVGASGYLVDAGAATEEIWKVVKVYTMPDGQKGVKVMKIA